MSQSNSETLDDLIASAESLKTALDASQQTVSVDLMRASARTAIALLAHGRADLSSELIDLLRRLARALDREASQSSCAAISDQTVTPEAGAEQASARALVCYFLGVELLHCARSGVPTAGEQAVGYFNEALGIANETHSPVLWGSIHEQLGRALSSSRLPDCERNREAARRHFATAQMVFNQAAHPLHWARLQLQLARTYTCSTAGAQDEESRSANASKAIAHARDAVRAIGTFDHTAEAHLAREYVRLLEGVLAMTSKPTDGT